MSRTVAVVAAMAAAAFVVRAGELIGAGRASVVLDAALVALTLIAVTVTAYVYESSTTR